MIKKLYGVFAVLLMWFVLHILLQTPAIPNPMKTLYQTIKLAPVLLPHLAMSLVRILSAIVVSAIVGTMIGIFMAQFKKLEEVLAPIVYILYPIPKIAFLPILMLLFGLGETPKILLIVSIIIFQFLMSAKDAVKEIRQEYLDSAKSLRIKGIELYKHIIIPAILPSFFTTLRISVGVSIAVLFFGENFSTKLGIGYFIMNSYAMVNYVSMYAGIVALSVFGLFLFYMIDRFEIILCPWLEK